MQVLLAINCVESSGSDMKAASGYVVSRVYYSCPFVNAAMCLHNSLSYAVTGDDSFNGRC